MRELEKIKMILWNATGLDLGYAYDDLAFSEHGIIIIKFHDNEPKKLSCYINKDLYENERKESLNRLIEEAEKSGFKLSYAGNFEMGQKKGKPEGEEEIELKFFSA